MDDARGEILARVRAALADRPAPAAVVRDYERSRSVPDPVGLLVERVADYKAIVHRVAEAEVPERIAERLAARGVTTMAVPADVPGPWRAPGVTWLPDEPPLALAELDGVGGVLTGCAAAIAETGTIVLDAGAAQGRRMLSLVPDYHLCVVRADQVAVSVPEALARLEPVRPLTFISGPSATSDIELDRVEGVHGPRTLEVLVSE
ncbi:L-lactate dehydrogenase complex protein LldG [Prauserella shujinwangii]|uniref:L-lactate dehydrogenase complex protein LldG n=1 Tax=Prauserella shujinwangii TaxID=1453103 RepID=A0A2T0LN30_9PSEU|nr:lactate utilization protein C [Prauserella shujinwangii]PRX44607.1 L-lactate dehydrogenase complex protein LldG [Prauserella shujinwangii]